jgi:hypothetical protein
MPLHALSQRHCGQVFIHSLSLRNYQRQNTWAATLCTTLKLVLTLPLVCRAFIFARVKNARIESPPEWLKIYHSHVRTDAIHKKWIHSDLAIQLTTSFEASKRVFGRFVCTIFRLSWAKYTYPALRITSKCARWTWEYCAKITP